jgi:hypothetical protein
VECPRMLVRFPAMRCQKTWSQPRRWVYTNRSREAKMEIPVNFRPRPDLLHGNIKRDGEVGNRKRALRPACCQSSRVYSGEVHCVLPQMPL